MFLISDKKKFLLKLLIFLVFLFVLDKSFGALMKNLFFSQSSGKYYRMSYAINKTESDIVIFGSSRAHTQYIPGIISQKLNMSCYNAGVTGQGILFASAIQEMMLSRYAPKVMILNIDPALLDMFPKFYGRISDLLPRYDSYPAKMDKYVKLKNKYETIKLFSALYPFNSKILHIVKYSIKPQADYDGYTPLSEVNRVNSYGSKLNLQDFYFNDEKALDKNFVECFDNFVYNSINAKVRLVFVLAPFYLPIAGKEKVVEYCASLRYMNNVAINYKIPFIDLSEDTTFTLNDSLFNDITHLNHAGAILFSKKLADSLFQIIHQNTYN